VALCGWLSPRQGAGNLLTQCGNGRSIRLVTVHNKERAPIWIEEDASDHASECQTARLRSHQQSARAPHRHRGIMDHVADVKLFEPALQRTWKSKLSE